MSLCLIQQGLRWGVTALTLFLNAGCVIAAKEAAAPIEKEPIVVAILDSGVDREHPALVGCVLPFELDFCQYGPGEEDLRFQDEDGHGSAVAALVSANGYPTTAEGCLQLWMPFHADIQKSSARGWVVPTRFRNGTLRDILIHLPERDQRSPALQVQILRRRKKITAIRVAPELFSLQDEIKSGRTKDATLFFPPNYRSGGALLDIQLSKPFPSRPGSIVRVLNMKIIRSREESIPIQRLSQALNWILEHYQEYGISVVNLSLSGIETSESSKDLSLSIQKLSTSGLIVCHSGVLEEVEDAILHAGEVAVIEPKDEKIASISRVMGDHLCKSIADSEKASLVFGDGLFEHDVREDLFLVPLPKSCLPRPGIPSSDHIYTLAGGESLCTALLSRIAARALDEHAK